MKRHPCDVRLPCGLTARAKAHARDVGRDLKDVVGDAMRLYLAGRDGVTDRPPIELAAALLAAAEFTRRPDMVQAFAEAGVPASVLAENAMGCVTLARDVLSGEVPEFIEAYRKHLAELSK